MAAKEPGPSEKSMDQEELLVAIGQRAKDLRLAAGLTQKEVANTIGGTQAYISAIEAGGQNLTVTVLQRLGEALGGSIGSFFPQAESITPSDESLLRLASVLERLANAVEGRRAQEEAFLDEIGELSMVRGRLEAYLKSGKGRRR